MPRGSGGAAALAGVTALVGTATDLGSVLTAALDLVAHETGALTAVMYLGDPAAGGLDLRGVGGPGDPAPATGLRPATAPGVCAALAAGRDAACRGALGPELAGLGLGGGRIIPARAGGRTVAALGLAPAVVEDDEGEAALRAAAQVLGLGLRNVQLASGVRDRVRELDRQAVQLGALTEIARRVAASLEPAEAHRVVVTEARALVRAHRALLLLPGRAGALEVAAAEGDDRPDPALDAEVRRAAGGAAGRAGSRVAVPVPGAEGALAPAAGVIAVARAHGNPFDDDDVERLRGLAAQASIALANARLLSDLRREQEERRSLAAAIVLAQEQERRRIAEDLHDGPVQELVGVGLLLDALAAELAPASPGSVEDVARAAAAARESVRGLRRAIADLHPLLLEQLGFAAAVRSLLERLEWSGIGVDVDVAAADRLPETARTVAFRIVQEAVANVARHAGATRVAVRAHERGRDVVVEVRDDGRGFDPAAPRAGVAEGHLGLAAIEERARLAGGALTIRSAPGKGTVVELVLPAAAGGEDQAGGGGIRSSAADSAAWSAKRSSTTT